MSKFNDLAGQLQEKAQAEKEQEFDANQMFEEWRQEVQALFGLIEAWLTPLTNKGLVKVSRSILHLHESFAGKSYNYGTEELAVDGSIKVRFKPVGRIIVGSQGRVDIIGIGQEQIMLTRNSENEGGPVEWFITQKVKGPAGHPQRKQERLTEDALADLLGKAGKS